MIIKPTSHFIGLTVSSDVFRVLFDRLALYIENSGIQDSVELQGFESLHITLYYLSKSVSDNEMLLYTQFSKSNPKIEKIMIHSMQYFHRNDFPYILFILPENSAYFQQMNREFASIFQREDIIDNQFSYIPHITIIRILDSDIFIYHRECIEKIIQDFIGKIGNIHLDCILNLYAVDSGIHPELQERIF